MFQEKPESYQSYGRLLRSRFWDVTQRSTKVSLRGPLRDIPKNGCEEDQSYGCVGSITPLFSSGVPKVRREIERDPMFTRLYFPFLCILKFYNVPFIQKRNRAEMSSICNDSIPKRQVQSSCHNFWFHSIRPKRHQGLKKDLSFQFFVASLRYQATNWDNV